MSTRRVQAAPPGAETGHPTRPRRGASALPIKGRANIRKGQSGFTLLEVLVSFVILAFAVIAGLRIFEEGLSHIRAVEARNAAVTVAQNILARLRIAPAVTLGTERGSDNGWRWESRLSALTTARTKPGAVFPVHVEIDVFSQDSATPIFGLETVILSAREPGRGVSP